MRLIDKREGGKMKRISGICIVVCVATWSLIGCGKGEEGQPQTAQEKVVSGQLERVEEQVKTMAGKVEAVAQQGDNLRQRLDDLEKRLDRLGRVDLARSAPAENRKAPPEPVKRVVVAKAEPVRVEKKAPEPEKEPVKLEPVDPVPTKTEEEKVGEPQAGGADGADGDKGSAGEVNILPGEGEFNLLNIKFASKIDRKSRQPVDPRGEFALADGKVYAWMVFSNKSSVDTQAQITWYRGDKVINTIPLNVGKQASHWRTWSYAQLSKRGVGDWKVEVKDSADNLMGSATFAVTE